MCAVSHTALTLYIFNIQNYSLNNLCKHIPAPQPFHWVFAILGLVVVGPLSLCDGYQSLHARFLRVSLLGEYIWLFAKLSLCANKFCFQRCAYKNRTRNKGFANVVRRNIGTNEMHLYSIYFFFSRCSGCNNGISRRTGSYPSKLLPESTLGSARRGVWSPPGSSEGSEQPSSTGSLALASPGSQKPRCEARTLVLCTAARSPPGPQGWKRLGTVFYYVLQKHEKCNDFPASFLSTYYSILALS